MIAVWPAMREVSISASGLGCPAHLPDRSALLAERYRSGTLMAACHPLIWLSRATLPGAAELSNIFFYHAPIHVSPLWCSAAPFLPLCYVWLSAVLERLQRRPSHAWPERFGLASYSLFDVFDP